MFKLFFCLQIFLLIGFSAFSSDQEKLSLYDLHCEGLTNPFGIATTAPGLSWKIASSQNGTRQNAYQIIAASDSTLLTEQSADLWISGKLTSATKGIIVWGGKQLDSRSLVYWKVRVWDQNDQASSWSSTNFFSVGLLAGVDWKADYIGLPIPAGNPESPLLTTHLKLSGKADKRFIYVNSLGYHEVYINGVKVGNALLAPAVSQFNKRSLSLTYDVSSYLKEGDNDLVLWLGRGWYTADLPGVEYKGPLVKARLEELVDGKWNTVCATGPTWKGRVSGYSAIENGKGGHFGGEKINANTTLADLTGPSLEKETWSPVYIANIPKHLVTPQTVEVNKIQGEVDAVNVKSFGRKTWLVDMGTTLSGIAEVKFDGLKAGQEVILQYTDHLEKDGKFVSQHQEDTYVARGTGAEIFKSKFNYHGFRYLKISNLKVEPRKESFKAFLVHTDYKPAATFACSDKDLNTIHDMLFYTLKCLSIGGYLVDCPQLERLGYGGDGNASTLTAQTMFDLGPLYSNWLQAWGDCVNEDGGMPHTAPCPYPAGGGPYWCAFMITASYKTYLNYGDARVLEKYYPVMQQWLGYVAKYSPDGLLQPWPETNYRGWYLGDWAVPEGVDQKDKGSINLVDNCVVSQSLEKMEKIANLLGKKEDAQKYALQNEKLKKQIHQAYFNSAKYSYASGSQIDNSYPLLTNLVPDSLISKVTQSLQNEIVVKRGGHIATGLVGIPIFTEWAVKNKAVDLYYNMLKKPDYPGFLYMIDQGATTTWEHWSGQRSRIHNCYNGIGSWFYQAVGGIRPDDNYPGYTQVFIDPQIPTGVTWAKSTKETPNGKLAVNWAIENKILKIEVEVPVGCLAKVVLKAGTKAYTLNEKSVALGSQDPNLVSLESGKFTLSYQL
jgi:alpha-L-rhamnosidase